ncbi:MAG: hypothetical protein E4G90_06085, partial [Gemmatimonadales bacterium]
MAWRDFKGQGPLRNSYEAQVLRRCRPPSTFRWVQHTGGPMAEPRLKGPLESGGALGPKPRRIMIYRIPTRVLAHRAALLALPCLAILLPLALAWPSLLGAQIPASQRQPRLLTDLRAVLDTGVVLQDRNGDRVVDNLELQILLSPEPTEAEVAAAANLAARFGYETSATDLGLVGRAESRQVHRSPVFLVGDGAVEGAGLPGGSHGLLEGLAPGQGVLTNLPAGGNFAEGALAVVGYDATGLLAVAGYLS